MGKILIKIQQLQKKEGLTLPELFAKYPHLAQLQYEEVEEESLKENKDKEKKLLLD